MTHDRAPMTHVARVIALLVILAAGLAAWQTADAAPPRRQKKNDAAAVQGPRDYRSPRFVIHTDLSAEDAQELLARLETMLTLVSNYWGRPPRGIIECYIVEDLARWPPNSFHPEGLAKIQEGAGVCLSVKQTRGEQFVSKAVVYAVAQRGVPQHESVHAYAQQTFGRVGPIWYGEGMAELGHYWKEGEKAVRADPVVIRYLREGHPRPLAQLVAETQHTGDWHDYCWWWVLCHLLSNNPNYADQFRPLGLGLLLGKDVSFEQTYGPVAKEIEFEYRFFLEHLEEGYRVDLCAWDWKKKFRPLTTSATPVSVMLQADRGWQPSGLSVVSEIEYEYAATGHWKTAKDGQPVDADGSQDGAGRLEGILMRDYQLSRPFNLGTGGTFRFSANGDLYLRCRDAWNELADNSGRVSVKLKVQGRGTPLAKPKAEKEE